jgi:hypothetical protein
VPHRVLPGRAGTRVGLDVLGGGSGQVQQGEEAIDHAALAPDHEEALGLPLPPSRRDRRRLRALPFQDQVQDRLPVSQPRRLGIAPAPRVPVDRGRDAGKTAEQVLGVGDRLLLRLASGRPQAAVDVAADPADHPPVAVGVAPAQVGLQGVAGQVVRVHALRSRLHEGQLPQPGERLMPVLQPEHLPHQRLGGHPGQRAHLQGTAVRPAGDDLDEPPQQDPHQVRGQRIGGRLAAADDHVGQQRQPQRVAMGQLDQLVVAGGVHATGSQVLAALLRAEVAQRHHPQQLPPGRVGPPGRLRRRPPGDHRQGGGRQPRQQPGAHPVVQQAQPLVGVEQEHHPGRAGRPQDGALPLGHLEHPAQRLQHGRRRRDEVAPVDTGHPGARVRGQPREHVEQPRLADPRRPVDVEHRELRFGRLQRHPEQLDLGCAADEPAPPARRQQVAERPGGPRLGHGGRIGAGVRHG